MTTKILKLLPVILFSVISLHAQTNQSTASAKVTAKILMVLDIRSPESANKFFYIDGTDRQVEFEMDANKKVSKAWMISNGVKLAFQKI